MPPKRFAPTNGGGGSIPPPPFAKKECRFYNSGSCRNGGKCRFLHLARTEAPASAATTSNTTVGRVPTIPDFRFNNSSGEPQTTVHTQLATVPGSTSRAGGPPAQPASNPRRVTRHGFSLSVIGRRLDFGSYRSQRRARKRRGVGATAGAQYTEPAVTPSPPVPSELPPAQIGEPENQPATTGQRVADEPCLGWQRGLCEWGDQCRHKHDPQVRHRAPASQ